MVISAPKQRLTAAPIQRRAPVRPRAVAAQTELASLQIAHDEERRRRQQGDAHPDLDVAAGQASHAAGTEPGTEHGRGDEQEKRRRFDRDDADEDRGLDDGRERVPDVQRSRYALVGNEAQELEERGRRRERPYAQRVEEVRDETDSDGDRGRTPFGHDGAVPRNRPE